MGLTKFVQMTILDIVKPYIKVIYTNIPVTQFHVSA